MSNRAANIFAVLISVFIFALALYSAKDDSLTMDELAHLPAGYSYLTQKDMRLNPEHPPLIKDLAGFPLLFIQGIHFPAETKPWQEDVNGQWEFGRNLLFKSGNPAYQMIFWGRIPMLLMLLLLGFYVFKWSRELFRNNSGILALILFALSPTLLAHGRLVTTDIGAAAGFLIGTYYFIKALKIPNTRNIVFAGIALAFAELAKFSTIILLPLFVIFSLVWWYVSKTSFKQILKVLFFAILISFIILWFVYLFHVWNYPTDKMIRDINILQSGRPIPILTPVLVKVLGLMDKISFLKPITSFIYGIQALFDLSSLLSWMAGIFVLKPYTQYLLGLFLVIQRGVGGNTTYFLGEVSAAGWKYYFPIVYAIKETITFHILTLLALGYSISRVKQPLKQTWIRLSEWTKYHFSEFTLIFIVAAYWSSTLTSNLNIGVRHLLPTIPIIIVLVSGALTDWFKSSVPRLKYAIVGLLVLFEAVSVFSVYPNILTYFNEIIGGPDKGYLYVTDSNLDWGQDLKRLKQWTDKNNIDKIYVDYFGGSNAEYYLGDKYLPWWGSRSSADIPAGNYLAVSATFLQGGRGKAAPGFNETTGYYRWLDNQELVAKIGYSIFVYRIE